MGEYGYVTKNIKEIKPRFYVYSEEYRDFRSKLYDYGYDHEKNPIVISRDNRIIGGVFQYNAIKDGYGDVDVMVNKIRVSLISFILMMPLISVIKHLPFNEKIIKILIDQNFLPKNYEFKKDISGEIRQILDDKRKELELTFIEDTHTYYMKDIDGEIKTTFPSVSKVLKKFYPEFPTDEAAEKKSKGDPFVKQQLIEEWAAAGDYSTNMGSRVHYILEKSLIQKYGDYKEVRQPVFDCDFTQILKGDSMVSAGNKYLKLMEGRDVVLLDTEIVLGHPELGYTGQPDKVWLVVNKKGDEFGLLITDWKTNKPKNFQSNNFTKPTYKPFGKQPNTALGHYYVQLPLYGKLLLHMLKGTKYENIRLYGCIVVLLREDSEYEEYRVPQEVIDTVLNMNMKDYLN